MKHYSKVVAVLNLLLFGLLANGSVSARSDHVGSGKGGVPAQVNVPTQVSVPAHASVPAHVGVPAHIGVPLPVSVPAHVNGSGRIGGYDPAHSRGARVGNAVGVPLYGPGYTPTYAYRAPAYAFPAPAFSYPVPAYDYLAPAYSYAEPVAVPSGEYVEQGYAQAAPASQQDWFYCADSNAYYPYVTDCPGGWERVPSQPQR
jgi:hypothetical protein